MRPIFAGNLEYDTRQSELERLFAKYGRVERVDMKSGIIIVFVSSNLKAKSILGNLLAYFFRKGFYHPLPKED